MGPSAAIVGVCVSVFVVVVVVVWCSCGWGGDGLLVDCFLGGGFWGTAVLTAPLTVIVWLCIVGLGAQDERTPLHFASYNGDIDAIKLLLAAKATVDRSDKVLALVFVALACGVACLVAGVGLKGAIWGSGWWVVDGGRCAVRLVSTEPM